jgi:general stress protein YciG
MAGTKAGGIRASETNRRLYGEDYYTVLGRKGGLVKVPKGFAKWPKERISEAGRKGGTTSSREGVKSKIKKEFL